MAKNKAFLLSILLALVCFSAFGTAGSLREQVAATYSGQLEVREATGRNDGPEVEGYLATVNLAKGYAWCGAFVNWVYRQHGVTCAKGGAMAMAWFPRARVIWRQGNRNASPQKADLFGLYYAHLKRIGHVGFIDQWDYGSGVAITVEGNTNSAGSREGDGVYRKRRLIRQIYAVSSWI